MKHIAWAVVVILLGVVALIPAAQAREHVSVGIGLGLGYGYNPYYAPYYGSPAYYYPPTYYAPPPTVVYQQAPQVIYAPPPSYVLPANQASPTFTDSQGRTCRSFQSSMDGAPVSGTACLQPDGSWRTVD